MAAALMLLSNVSSAFQVYVDIQRTTGNNDGTSWENAYRSPLALQDAIGASQGSQEIWIAEGTYLPADDGNQFAFFRIVSSLRLRGGFRGTESSPEERPPLGDALTILSGDLAGDDDLPGGSMLENTNTLITIDPFLTEPVFDRLVIRGGNANGQSFSGAAGGVFLFDLTLPTFIDCTFEKNRARVTGSAIFSLSGAGTFTGCTFQNNDAVEGSTIAMDFRDDLSFDRCRFIGNSGARNAALSAYRLTNGGATCTVTNCLFEGNTSTGDLGGTLRMGAANGEFGGRMSNCTVVGNQALASDFAGLTRVLGLSSMDNCIFWGNRGQGGAAGPETQVTAGVTVSRSIVEGGYVGGADVLDVDPQFIDAASGNYALLPTSPAIDSGANGDLVLDLDGRRRAYDDPMTPDTGVGAGPIVDLGASEFSPNLGIVNCLSQVNSTGNGGITEAIGALSVQANDFTLLARQLPVGFVGYFCASRRASARAFPPGSSGSLCLGGAIGRFVGPGQILTSDSTGMMELAVDLTQLPQPDQIVAASAGETWFFQAWHRDTGFFGATSNFSDGLQVTFLP